MLLQVDLVSSRLSETTARRVGVVLAPRQDGGLLALFGLRRSGRLTRPYGLFPRYSGKRTWQGASLRSGKCHERTAADGISIRSPRRRAQVVVGES